MDVETIIKLIDAGYTKAEIEQMTKAPEQDPAPDPAPAEAPDPEPAPDPAPETEPVKKKFFRFGRRERKASRAGRENEESGEPILSEES